MTCEEVKKIKSTTAPWDVTRGLRAAVRIHIKGCPECRAEQSALMATLPLMPQEYLDKVNAAMPVIVDMSIKDAQDPEAR